MTNWDSLFLLPFINGLLISIVLSFVGVLLRLRKEWLAALGFAHLAGASALIGLAIHIPAVVGASIGAVVGTIFKSTAQMRGNTIYGLMILIGWSITLLVAANTTLGSVMGHAMVEGQLYFAGKIHLIAAMLLFFTSLVVIYRLMPIIIRYRFFPAIFLGSENNNQLTEWRLNIVFDLFAAFSMAVATATIGLMAAFALVFVPPWLAFQLAQNWKQTVLISIGFATLAYILSFILALSLDQPFAPVLVSVLVFLASVLSIHFIKKF